MLSRLIVPLALLVPATAMIAAAPTASDGPDAAASTAPVAAAATPQRAVLRLRETRFGKVIHDKRTGLVAYLFTKEKRSKPACYGACAKAWPPIKTRKRPAAGSGIKRKDLGTARRRGGAKMVTYKGHPLYFYEDDRPGQILCNDVREFGGGWFVVNKRGKPVAN